MGTRCPLEESEVKMPYAVVEAKVAKLPPQYRGELLAFIDFLCSGRIALFQRRVRLRLMQLHLGGAGRLVVLLADTKKGSILRLISTNRWNVSRSICEVPS